MTDTLTTPTTPVGVLGGDQPGEDAELLVLDLLADLARPRLRVDPHLIRENIRDLNYGDADDEHRMRPDRERLTYLLPPENSPRTDTHLVPVTYHLDQHLELSPDAPVDVLAVYRECVVIEGEPECTALIDTAADRWRVLADLSGDERLLEVCAQADRAHACGTRRRRAFEEALAGPFPDLPGSFVQAGMAHQLLCRYYSAHGPVGSRVADLFPAAARARVERDPTGVDPVRHVTALRTLPRLARAHRALQAYDGTVVAVLEGSRMLVTFTSTGARARYDTWLSRSGFDVSSTWT